MLPILKKYKPNKIVKFMKILLSGLIAGLSGMKLSGNGKESDLDNLKLNILNKNEMVEINGEGQLRNEGMKI